MGPRGPIIKLGPKLGSYIWIGTHIGAQIINLWPKLGPGRARARKMVLAFSTLETLTGIWTLKNGHVLGCFFCYWLNLGPKLGPGPGPAPLLIMDLAFSALGTLTGIWTLKNGHVLGCFLGYWLNLGTYGDPMGPYGTL